MQKARKNNWNSTLSLTSQKEILLWQLLQNNKPFYMFADLNKQFLVNGDALLCIVITLYPCLYYVGFFISLACLQWLFEDHIVKPKVKSDDYENLVLIKIKINSSDLLYIKFELFNSKNLNQHQYSKEEKPGTELEQTLTLKSSTTKYKIKCPPKRGKKKICISTQINQKQISATLFDILSTFLTH